MKTVGQLVCWLSACSLLAPADAILPLFGLGEGFNLLDYALNPSLLFYTKGLNYVVDDIMLWLGLKKLDSSSCVNNGRWYNVLQGDEGASYDERLENCFIYVESTKKAYLIGGIKNGDPEVENFLRLDIYDPFTREWSNEEGPGVQVDHFQCVNVDDKIWVVAAWTGRDAFLEEDGLATIVVYDPVAGTWDMSRDGLSETRQRGGAAVIAHETDIYVMFGNQGGHGPGVAVNWADKYDTVMNVWTELPDASYRRDHTGGGLVNGKVCVAGGRTTELGLTATVLPTECYDPVTETWSIEADIPGRGAAGALYGITCDGQLMVAGGEYENEVADSNVYTFDGSKWTTQNRMRLPRHATHLAYIPDCNQMVAAAGSAKRFSRFKTPATDVFYGDGKKEECVAAQGQ